MTIIFIFFNYLVENTRKQGIVWILYCKYVTKMKKMKSLLQVTFAAWLQSKSSFTFQTLSAIRAIFRLNSCPNQVIRWVSSFRNSGNFSLYLDSLTFGFSGNPESISRKADHLKRLITYPKTAKRQRKNV